MDYADEPRAIMRRLPEIYRFGDIEGYLDHYAEDISAFHSAIVRGPNRQQKTSTWATVRPTDCARGPLLPGHF